MWDSPSTLASGLPCGAVGMRCIESPLTEGQATRSHMVAMGDGAALECLASLRQIMDGLMASGHEGMVTFTEFCSACLDAEALDAMKELQDESEDARLLFEAVVPRIWCS